MINRCCILVFLLTIGVTIGHAQSFAPDSLPKSFTYSSLTKPLSKESDIQTITLPIPNVDSVEKIEHVLDSLGAIRPYRFGLGIPVNISNHTNGTLEELEGGSFIWRVKFICPGAKSINFGFNSTSLPLGSFLYAYNSDKTSLEGPWYNRNTRSGKKLGTFPVQGSEVIIEIYIPQSKLNNVILELEKVIYGFRQTESLPNINLVKYRKETIQSLSCEQNVSCSYGNDWCREKYSIAKILAFGYDGWCTGSLLNNVREDFTPYFLTAFHCLDVNDNGDGTLGNGELSQDERDQVDIWSFQFGYIVSCYGGNAYSTHSYSGAVFRAAWHDTDFALLELEQEPASGEVNFPDVYFNGWDRTGNTPTNATCLHHPRGDYMKIAIDNQSPTICGTIVQNGLGCDQADPTGSATWRTRWDVGTTEPGSSGSPLFDQSRKVIGQLWGGCHCELALNNSAFGRLSVSWVGGGNDNDGLRNWLDPDETGATTLNGIKLDNLQYGENFASGTYARNAYDRIRIGSGDDGYGGTLLWSVQSGVTMNVKAGREIQIRPCTWIRSGAEARFSIGNVSCSDVIQLSHNESKYKLCTGSVSNQGHGEKQTIHDTPTFNELSNGGLDVIPNPTDGLITIYYTVENTQMGQIDIVNLYGQSISVVANGEQVQGNHTVNFNTSDLASGVYFVQFRSQTGVISKPIVVSR